MNIKFDIKSQFDNIINLTEQLIVELQNQELKYCSYFKLPEISEQEESLYNEKIQVQEFTAQEAFDKCCASLTDVFKKSNMSGRVLKRNPGIIAINSSEPDLITSRIKQINDAKNKFRTTITNIGNNDARFDAVHSAVPNLITLCAYRNIHFETQSPYSVRFTWMNKHSIKLLSKEDALTMLDNSEVFGSSNKINLESWQALVHKEKLEILSLNDNEKLKIRRPTRVSPQVNIRYDAQNRYHVSAALPFILINPSENVKFGVLKNYTKTTNDPRKKESHYLIERLYLGKNEADKKPI